MVIGGKTFSLAVVVWVLVLSCVVGTDSALAQETQRWEKKYPVNDAAIPGEADAIAVDSSGNVYVAGYEWVGTNADNGFVAKFTSAGVLDTTFNASGPTPGVATYNNAAADGNDYFFGVAVDGSGNVYVAGATDNGPNDDVIVLKYTSAGVLDTSFDTDGIVTYDGGSIDRGFDIAISGGSVYVTGYTHNGSDYDVLVLKYTSAGVLDVTFDTDGVQTYDNAGANDFGLSMTVSGGSVYLSGYTANLDDDILVLKYTSAGALDTTFSGDGVEIYGGLGDNDVSRGLAVDGSGNVFVAGYTDSNGVDWDVLVLKYDSTGTLDATFDSDGVAAYDSGSDDVSYKIVISGSSVYIAGYAYSGTDNDVLVLKYDSTGTLDTTFSGDGVQVYDSTSDDYGYSIAVDSSGNVYIGGGGDHLIVLQYSSAGVVTAFSDGEGYNEGHGVATDSGGNVYVTGYSESDFTKNVLVLKYTSSGALDTTFGTDGAVTYFGGGLGDSGESIAVDSSGNVYVAGWTDNGSDYDVLVLKYDSTGTLDTTFSGDGVQTYDSGGSRNEYGYGIALDGSGNVVVAGYSYNGADNDVIVLRYTSTGALDAGFGTAGLATYDGGIAEACQDNCLAVDSAGNVYVAGYNDNGPNENVLVLKFDATGTLDTTFSVDGVQTYDGGSWDFGTGIAVSGGDVYVMGYSHNGVDWDVVVLKYDATGTLDTTFSGDGIVVYDSGLGDDTGTGIAVSGGKVYVAGYASNGEDQDWLVMKYTSAGVLDTTFSTDGIATYDSGFGDDYAFSIVTGNSFFVTGTWGDGDLMAWTMKFGVPSASAAQDSSHSNGRCYIATAAYGSWPMVPLALLVVLIALCVHRLARTRRS